MPKSSKTQPSNDYVEKCLRAISEAPVVIYDTETSGLEKLKNFICGYVFTVGPRPDQTWYLPVRHKGGGNIPGCRIPKDKYDFNPSDVHPLEKEIAKIARDPNKHWIGHHLKFDMWMSARHGITLYGTVEDTEVNAALIDENQGQFNLGYCTQVMGVTAKKLEEIEKHIVQYFTERGEDKAVIEKEPMAWFWQLPALGMATEYAAGDGTSTFELHAAQQARLDADELRRVWAVEKRVTKTLFNIERRGTPVDEKILEKVEKKAAVMLKEAQAKLPEGMNVKSPVQCAKFLRSVGITDIPKTPTGRDSVTEDFLLTLEDHAKGGDIIRVRKLRNLSSTFLINSVRNNLINGKVHCDFNQLKMDEYGTVTGRLSSSGPNMQQIPKRDKLLAPLLRQIYRSSNYLWMSADYSQQEYRVFAEFARAKLVLEAYARDPKTDYHQFVADLLGVERDPSAKRINLGTIYNMGIKKLADKLGVPFSVAQGYMMRMRALMPEAAAFNRGCQRKADARGYVRTVLGRRRRFPNQMFTSKAGNAVIQGTSADITKTKMVEVDDFLISEGLDSHLILQVHDDLNFMINPEEEKEFGLSAKLKAIMEDFSPGQTIELTVPMIVDTGLALSWGHASFGKKYSDWV